MTVLSAETNETFSTGVTIHVLFSFLLNVNIEMFPTMEPKQQTLTP